MVLGDAYQSEAKASTELLPLLPSNRRKVSAERLQGLLLSLSYFMSRLLDIPPLDLIKPCSRPVYTFCQETQREKSNPPQRAASLFLLFSNIIGDMAGTKHTEGVR